ncbi:probable serine/threonine-protein kinase DDB_G0271682 [Drosophila ficusphila]|uniref:probable serine/threonine-protein kinase DDB_G0271682 n=1 Tax=Drosophila ficusphila TaxID=30025 RepID=UPI0007E64F52|nr:probable serine/threonine-protein kinase DDB_G0271682 [Drosophila ficusphila]
MVLTNFECWAHGDPPSAASFETGTLRPSMDPFNPRAVNFMTDANNNNNNNNEMQSMPEVLPLEVLRCKKRMNPGRVPGEDVDVDQPVYTKRCRYDEADLAAQYCNDFFSLPATQVIGTQACLMDYEMQATGGMMMESETSFPAQQQHHQQQQQQQPPQQHQHQRIHQHYQESAEQRMRPPQQKSRKCIEPFEKIRIKSIGSEAEADLYIATHGGCLHHFRKLSGSEQEESDI